MSSILMLADVPDAEAGRCAHAGEGRDRSGVRHTAKGNHAGVAGVEAVEARLAKVGPTVSATGGQRGRTRLQIRPRGNGAFDPVRGLIRELPNTKVEALQQRVGAAYMGGSSDDVDRVAQPLAVEYAD